MVADASDYKLTLLAPAVGFCFGGACVLEMARAGLPLKAVVSMHGILTSKPLDGFDGSKAPAQISQAPPNQFSKDCHILVCNGINDSMVSQEMIRGFEKEMGQAPVASWTFCNYGKAIHAFTTPRLGPPNGIVDFEPNACRRAWISACDLFVQALGLQLKQSQVSLEELWKGKAPAISLL